MSQRKPAISGYLPKNHWSEETEQVTGDSQLQLKRGRDGERLLIEFRRA